MTTTNEATQSITLARPEGITDGRWAALQSMAPLVITGHAPRCTDHSSEPGERGYCRQTFHSGVGVEVELTDCSLDGRTQLSLYMSEGDIDTDSLSRAIATGLTMAADAAQLCNLTVGMPE